VGPFELNWQTEQYKCWIAQYITFGLLASLQAVNLFWFYLILRIAKNYVVNAVVTDERSDNEEEEEEQQEGEEVDEEDKDAAVDEEVHGKEGLKRMTQGEKRAETENLSVLLNGRPVSGQAHVEGIVERRKKR
jgi:very-long-chain ceramide synthase